MVRVITWNLLRKTHAVLTICFFCLLRSFHSWQIHPTCLTTAHGFSMGEIQVWNKFLVIQRATLILPFWVFRAWSITTVNPSAQTVWQEFWPISSDWKATRLERKEAMETRVNETPLSTHTFLTMGVQRTIQPSIQKLYLLHSSVVQVWTVHIYPEVFTQDAASFNLIFVPVVPRSLLPLVCYYFNQWRSRRQLQIFGWIETSLRLWFMNEALNGNSVFNSLIKAARGCLWVSNFFVLPRVLVAKGKTEQTAAAARHEGAIVKVLKQSPWKPSGDRKCLMLHINFAWRITFTRLLSQKKKKDVPGLRLTNKKQWSWTHALRSGCEHYIFITLRLSGVIGRN